MEAMRLRVKDVEFARREILVRDGKGHKDRITMLPVRLVGPLRDQLGARARVASRRPRARDSARSGCPSRWRASIRGAAREWGWQYVFPARRGRSIPVMAHCAGIICPTRRSSAR